MTILKASSSSNETFTLFVGNCNCYNNKLVIVTTSRRPIRSVIILQIGFPPHGRPTQCYRMITDRIGLQSSYGYIYIERERERERLLHGKCERTSFYSRVE